MTFRYSRLGPGKGKILYCAISADYNVMTTFEKVMTREAPLIMVEAWSAAFTEALPKLFGFPWPAPFFISRNGVVESWRPTKLFHEMLPKHVARWLRLPRNRQRLLRAFVGYERYAKQIRRLRLVKPKHRRSRDLIREIAYIARAFTNGCAGLIPAFWIAQWHNRAVTTDGKPLFDAPRILAKAEAIRKTDRFMDDCTDLIGTRLRIIAQQELLPPALVNSMLLAELKNMIQGKHDVHTIAKRRQGYAYFQSRLLLLAALPPFLRRHGYYLKEPRTISAARLSGTVAHSGTARGIVKVVYKRDELHKVKKGDILVAPMTTPWYLPAMKQAAAFITDEGGMLCHAVIVSREMKKPCIIGTKIATRVFKDGDLVEVDTLKGTVRKIK